MARDDPFAFDQIASDLRAPYTQRVARTSAQLLAEALVLAPEERTALAAELLASVDDAGADWESAWYAEVERRAAAADARTTLPADWPTVRARLLAKLSR